MHETFVLDMGEIRGMIEFFRGARGDNPWHTLGHACMSPERTTAGRRLAQAATPSIHTARLLQGRRHVINRTLILVVKNAREIRGMIELFRGARDDNP